MFEEANNATVPMNEPLAITTKTRPPFTSQSSNTESDTMTVQATSDKGMS